MSPVTTTMSGCRSTPNETAIRIVRRFSEGLPAWKSDRCRIESPSSSGGRLATGTSSARVSSHCDSNRPHAASAPPATKAESAVRLELFATHAVELVAKTATGGGDPLAQHLDALFIRGVAVS